MNDFKIQPYTKKELALFYFPTADPHVAVNRLMSWVNRCKPLHKALLRLSEDIQMALATRSKTNNRSFR